MKFNFDKLKEYKMYHILMPICLAVCKTKMKVQYIGKENVPKEGGFILACNHSSNFDPIALGALMSDRYILCQNRSFSKIRFPHGF